MFFAEMEASITATLLTQVNQNELILTTKDSSIIFGYLNYNFNIKTFPKPVLSFFRSDIFQIYFRFKGGHKINTIDSDLELQLNFNERELAKPSAKINQGNLVLRFNIINEEDKQKGIIQNKFFDSFLNLKNLGNLPIDIVLVNMKELINELSAYENQIYLYIGKK